MNNDLLSKLALGILLICCLFSKKFTTRLAIYWGSLFLVTGMGELTAIPIGKAYNHTPNIELKSVMARRKDNNCDDDDDKNPCK